MFTTRYWTKILETTNICLLLDTELKGLRLLIYVYYKILNQKTWDY